ncbi:TraM recognition domain-containing protein [Spiroplasma sp. SV19]|nr:TraM recognition domain-containing protein [Spiroplasma sp. SV19]
MFLNEKKQFWSKIRKEHLTYGLIVFPFFLTLVVILIPCFKVFKMEGFKLLKYFQFLWIFMQSNIVFIVVLSLVSTLLFWTGLILWIVCLKEYRKVQVKDSNSTEYGTAKWIVDELEKKGNVTDFNELYPANTEINIPGWVVRFTKTKNDFVFNIKANTHALVLGATNSGKSQKVVMPSAIYNSKVEYDQKPCMVFTDPKGELYSNLSKPLAENGYQVLTLDLRDAKSSSSWNPLAIAYKYYYDAVTIEQQIRLVTFNSIEDLKIKLDNYQCYDHDEQSCDNCFNNVSNKVIVFEKMWFYDEVKANKFCEALRLEYRDKAIDEINDLITTIWPLKGHENDHFSAMAGSVAKCVMLGMLELLVNDLDALPLEMFNLPTIAVLCSDRKRLKTWFNKLPIKSFARIVGANALGTGDKEQGSIFSTLDKGLQIYQDIGIQSIVCKNDIDLFRFTEKPKALFLIVPDEKTNRHIFASLLVTQLYKANVAIANESKNKRLPRDIQFYLDEFGNMPTIPNFQGFVTVARSRGMYFLIILQDFKQLYKKYGQEDGSVIKSNCSLNIYISSGEITTAKEYSEMLGIQTVEVITYSTSRDPKTKKIIKNPPQTRLEGMELIKASDLFKLKNPYGVVFSARENPAKVYMESSWKFAKEFNLGKEQKPKTINTVNFLTDYYFDLFAYIPGKLDDKYDILIEQETKREITEAKNEINIPNINNLLAKSPLDRTPEERAIVEKYRNIKTKLNKEQTKNLIVAKNKQDLK